MLNPVIFWFTHVLMLLDTGTDIYSTLEYWKRDDIPNRRTVAGLASITLFFGGPVTLISILLLLSSVYISYSEGSPIASDDSTIKELVIAQVFHGIFESVPHLLLNMYAFPLKPDPQESDNLLLLVSPFLSFLSLVAALQLPYEAYARSRTVPVSCTQRCITCVCRAGFIAAKLIFFVNISAVLQAWCPPLFMLNVLIRLCVFKWTEGREDSDCFAVWFRDWTNDTILALYCFFTPRLPCDTTGLGIGNVVVYGIEHLVVMWGTSALLNDEQALKYMPKDLPDDAVVGWLSLVGYFALYVTIVLEAER